MAKDKKGDARRSVKKSKSEKSAAMNADAPLGEVTLRELIEALRSQFVSRDEQSGGMETAIGGDQTVSDEWQEATRIVEMIGPSPTDVQVCFLEGLMNNPDEAEEFLKDPAGFSREAGVLLDPELVREISDVVLFGRDLETHLGDKLSPGALVDVARMREMPNKRMISDAASSAAATAKGLVGSSGKINAKELMRVKGLDSKGVRLPGGRVLRSPKDITVLTVASNNAVAVYATSAITASGLVTASDRRHLSALRSAAKGSASRKK
mmetsp:Transcript_29159/g.56246  ORF Transcript_29159/g.56246 Transcript_29159/m.56246 type:complete len:266 (+) Transcript_29159:700-1497(+)